MVKSAINFLFENSIFLIVGAIVALVWANTDNESYKALLHLPLFENGLFYDHNYFNEQVTAGVDAPKKVFTLHYLVNDVFMALFFAIAGKEVFEATLPGGALSNFRTAATPLIATIGGMAGPALAYLGAAYFMVDNFSDYSNGWAIPCATDIAFSYLVARIVFGGGHPAIPFLLLLAIADDALGLIILAVFYPQGEMAIHFMILPIIAIGIGLMMRKKGIKSFWPYLLGPGVISWCGFALSGLHPALGLLPIIPTLPHASSDKGLFNWEEMKCHDTLNEFEHWWKNPVELVLGLFGLLNAGVVMESVGPATTFVLLGLFVGKPIGIWLCGVFASSVLGFGLPEGMGKRDLWVLGCAAGIGFTVALFVASVAFPPGGIQDAAKMGALASFGAAFLTIISGKVLRVQKVEGAPAGHGHGH